MKRYGDVAELEIPYKLAGHAGDCARAGVPQPRRGGRVRRRDCAGQRRRRRRPIVSLVRRTQTKAGFGLGTQVELSEYVGAYARAGWSDGRTETFMFTEIDRSLAAGTLLKGAGWGRPDDSAGVAAYVNGLSRPHRDYLAAGGSGFFLGDGRLNYATERIIETFYSLGVAKGVWFSLGYQYLVNPGYNRDRGPANFVGFRVHAEL